MYSHELLAQFEYPSKKRKNNNQTHRGRPPGVAEDGGIRKESS